MKNEEINKKILNLWKRYYQMKHPGTKRWPLLLPKLNENCILFIGINPGFPRNNKNGRGYWANNGILDPEEYFKFPNGKIKEPKNIEKEIIREGNARKPKNQNRAYYSTFFGPIVKIMERITKEFEKENWEHIDLFSIRETSHKQLKKDIGYKKDEKIFMNDFAKEQLSISLNLIKELKPKIIVVQNAMASEIIQKEWNIGDSDFNNDFGFHIKRISDYDVPIFFSSILSGGRLDNGSLKRLEWHIKRAIEWSNKNEQK